MGIKAHCDMCSTELTFGSTSHLMSNIEDGLVTLERVVCTSCDEDERAIRREADMVGRQAREQAYAALMEARKR